MLSGLGGLAAAMARSFTYTVPALTVSFLVFFGLAALGVLVCLVLLGRAYLAQTYEHLPLLADLDRSAEECQAFNAYVRFVSRGLAGPTDISASSCATLSARVMRSPSFSQLACRRVGLRARGAGHPHHRKK